MTRRRKSLDEAAAKAGLSDREYVSRTMGAELKDALKASCKGIAERAKSGDQKAQYFVVEFFGKWAGPEDPRDKRASEILKGIERIRGKVDDSEEDSEEFESGDSEPQAEGDWADDPDEGGEGIPLEADEDSEDRGQALSPVAVIR